MKRRPADKPGVCAGGFLATQSADLFQTPFNRSFDEEMLIPQWLGSFAEHNRDFNSYAYSLKLFPDYKSVGPFYPNDSQMHFDTAKTYVPHRVSFHCQTSDVLIPPKDKPVKVASGASERNSIIDHPLDLLACFS
jgi:hypothetical protein